MTIVLVVGRDTFDPDLAALRFTTDADDPHTGTDILAEIDHHVTPPAPRRATSGR